MKLIDGFAGVLLLWSSRSRLAAKVSTFVVIMEASLGGTSVSLFSPSVVKMFLRYSFVGSEILFLSLFSLSLTRASWASTMRSLVEVDFSVEFMRHVRASMNFS